MFTPQEIEQISFGKQTFGGYDLYANIISAIALELYARLFDVLDEGGYAAAGEDCLTAAPGVFVAGDCRSKTVRQVTTAVADGAVAVHMAEEYLAGKA